MLTLRDGVVYSRGWLTGAARQEDVTADDVNGIVATPVFLPRCTRGFFLQRYKYLQPGFTSGMVKSFDVPSPAKYNLREV